MDQLWAVFRRDAQDLTQCEQGQFGGKRLHHVHDGAVLFHLVQQFVDLDIHAFL